MNQFKENIPYTNKIVLHFEGEMRAAVLDHLVESVEERLEDFDEPMRLRKKIVHIIVEALQNVYNYFRVEEEIKQQRFKTIRLTILKYEGYYELRISNYVARQKVENLRTQLERVNRLSEEKLRESYLNILGSQEFSAHGGAGLGILDIARKSGQKLRYRFKNANDIAFSLFCLHVNILTH